LIYYILLLILDVAANGEIERCNEDRQVMEDNYNTSQKELKKSSAFVDNLQASVQELQQSKDDMISHITDNHYEIEMLEEEIKSLKSKSNLLSSSSAKAISPVEESAVKVFRSTAAEEPDHIATDFIPQPSRHQEHLFPGLYRAQLQIDR
jgi:chromosome segregation ATPase